MKEATLTLSDRPVAARASRRNSTMGADSSAPAAGGRPTMK